MEFLYGHRLIHWKIFVQAVAAVSSLPEKLSIDSLNGGINETELAARLGKLDNGWRKPLIFELRHELHDDTSSLSLWSLLINSKLNLIQATEPRDMIYGLLGLVEDSELGVFIPDYSLTIQESFVSTSRNFWFKATSGCFYYHHTHQHYIVCHLEHQSGHILGE